MLNTSRHSLIFGLSYALDILGKNNLSHSKSTAYLSALLAREIGFAEDKVLSVYYAALLHDIGVTDDYDWRQKHIPKMKRHCLLGKELLEKLPLPGKITTYVLYHHENYDGSGAFGLSGRDIPDGSQMICLSSAFDDEFGEAQCFDKDLAIHIYSWLDANRTLFSPKAIEAFSKMIDREYFLLDYFNSETKYELSKKVILSDDVHYGNNDILKYALCFADIIDQRSPFTFRHSTGIAELAEKAAAHLGYDERKQSRMYLAGLLHDIGKLHIPTKILHKNGKLSPEERFEMNKHTYYTRKVLEQIQGFDEIVDIAANHHEKLDGTGYPYHLPECQLCELEKVMAICDVYQALSEDRPYRAKLPSEKVWKIIDDMVENNHLNGSLVSRLRPIFV